MDAEQLEGGVATPETLPLPSSPRKRQASQDPDHLLDAMLVDKLDDDAPKWAMTLHTSINSKLDKLISSNDDLTVRVDNLETKAVGDQSRISALEDQVQELKRALESRPRSAGASTASEGRQSDISDARPQSVSVPPPTSLLGETDFSHLVVGGWLLDTRRQVIEKDLNNFIAGMKIQNVDRTAVYSKRAKIAHIYLTPLSPSEARHRFFEMLPRINKKFPSSGGAALWVSPNKPCAVRQRNTLFGMALHRLLKATGTEADSPELDSDWTLGVVWVGDSRAMALECSNLLAGQSRVATIKFSAGLRVPGQCSFNLDFLSKLTGQTLQDLEAKLRTE